MKRKLRSNFEPGTTRWAVRRAQWRALGLTDADMEKPKIAIVNTSSELSICFSHLDGIAARLKTAIKAGGGWPFEIRTTAPSDFVTSAGKAGRYILASRDLIASDIEAAVEGAQLDGMVCLASCDKTAPGQLMAAARINIPAIVVACGYQASGALAGKRVDIEDAFEDVGRFVTGEIDLAQLTAVCDNAVRGSGVCSGMGTANSMHVVAEALGMALPATTPVLANSGRMWDGTERAGHRIVEMVEQDLKPRDIMQPAAFSNAIMTVLAVSGSINTIRHLQAIAVEAQCSADMYELVERHGREVPLLAAVRPNGRHTIEEFDAAGGTAAVMKALAPLLRAEALTVSGHSVRENLAEVIARDPEIIRPLDKPLSRTPALVVLRGSLAPAGGIVKLGTAAQHKLRFEGTAVVHESQQAALEALMRGEIKPAHVAVLRGMGPKGGPGVALASGFVAALDGAGLSESVAVVTDGQLSGLNHGLAVGQVSPEAAEGGPLALVANGDRISIDVASRACDLHVADEELERRRRRLAAWSGAEEYGWLGVYRQVVQPLARGAVLLDPSKKR